MAEDNVEERNGGYFVAGTRVSLDSVVFAFLRESPLEGIADSLPALTLEQVSGALTFYAPNREVVDRYLHEGRQEFEMLRQEARRKNPALHAKLAEAHRRSQTTSR